MDNYANDDIYRQQIEWHDNASDACWISTITCCIHYRTIRYCITLIGMLERFDRSSAQLRRSVLQPLMNRRLR